MFLQGVPYAHDQKGAAVFFGSKKTIIPNLKLIKVFVSAVINNPSSSKKYFCINFYETGTIECPGVKTI